MFLRKETAFFLIHVCVLISVCNLSVATLNDIDSLEGDYRKRASDLFVEQVV